MNARLQSLVAILTIGLVVPIAARHIAGQVRDPSGAAAPAGAGAIFGRVVTSDGTDHPARRATITVSGPGLTGTRIGVTDTDGRFVVDGLPDGHYTVAVTKPAYVRTLAGGKPGAATVQPTIDVAGGQRVQADVVLPRGAVITGQVVDGAGKPRPSVQVRAVSVKIRNGQRVVSPGAGSLSATDDDGGYRLYGLPAGDYVVTASLLFASTLSPHVSDEQLQWARRLASGAAAPGTPASPPSSHGTGYAPAYYPGSADINAASIVTVGTGEERSGVDIALTPVTLARLEGTVTGAVDFSNPGAVQMSVVAASLEPGVLQPPIAPFVRPDRTGRFAVDNIAPGRYLIAIRTTPNVGRGAPDAPPPPSLWAAATVDVNGEDVTDIALELQRGLALSGKVAVDGATPFDFTRIRVGLRPAESSLTLSPALASASADGTFTITDVIPGGYRFSVAGTPPEWSVKSIDVAGTDAADRGVEIGAGQTVSNVVVTLTDRAASLSGSLLDRAGHGVPYWLMLFSIDRANWSPGSRRTRQVRATNDGTYSIKGVPAGEYYLVAIPDMTQIDLSDPATFDELAASGYKLTLGEGEQKKQDLRTGGSGSIE